MNITENLNFKWRYYKEYKEEYLEKDDSSKCSIVNIPHTNIELPYNNFDERMYAFVSCYKKNIDIPKDYEGKTLLISFEAVASYTMVYVNGRFAGEHKGGYTPFDIRIDSMVNYGEENVITVVVDSREREEIPPFGNVIDYLTYGGIYREVYLKVLENAHINDIYIKTLDVLNVEKKLEVQVEIEGRMPNMSLEYEIIDEDKVIGSFSSIADLKENENIIKAIAKVKDMKLWSINDPKLYYLRVSLKSNDEVVHTEKVRFGIREVKFKADGFYLNGRRIKLRGLNRHQSFPYTGYAMPKSMQEKDADILKKELGVNIVRTSHYPQSRHFLNRCDELGLLVFTEIPGWQHIGDSDEWRNITLQHVREMITRNRNHPSIIIWGVRINESKDCDDLYKKTNELAHRLDSTRPTGGVRNFAGSNLFEDVYTYNDFVHSGNNKGLEQPYKIKKKYEIPYLVTEHNGHMFPTKRFDNEERRLEHALRHLRVMNDMYGSDGTSGCIGWCMFDYNTHKDFGSGDRICYHGVMDMFRIPKLAAYAYSSQQDKYPVMEVSSSMDIGEHPATNIGDVYVFTNCDYIKLYKNDKYIKTFTPCRMKYSNLPHPPVIIDDLIGDAIEVNEGMSHGDAEKVKEFIKLRYKYGNELPVSTGLKMGILKGTNRLSQEDLDRMFTTYSNDWGGTVTTYKFEGYKNKSLVKTVIKGPVMKPQLKVTPDENILVENETYDVTRIVIEAKDENDNVLPYAENAFSVNIEGPLDLIGSKITSLIGGARAIYVKTKGQSGTARITICSENLGTQEIEVEVQKVECRI